MPHTRSAKKRHRQDEKRRLRNRSTKRTIKTHIKRFLTSLDASAESPEQAAENRRKEFALACKRLDKAAAKRIIHPNKASRKKAQLARLLHQAETAPADTSETEE